MKKIVEKIFRNFFEEKTTPKSFGIRLTLSHLIILR